MKKLTGIVAIIAMVALVASCGSGSSSSSSTATTDPFSTISIMGTVQAPASTNVAVPIGKGITKAMAESGADTTGHVYTLDGEDLGTFDCDASGAFTMASVDLETLKGDDDTGTTWSEDVVLVADNGVETYANVDVVEGTTTSIDLGTANTDTTLAAQALADKISGWNGWGVAYSASNVDFECIFNAQKTMWAAASMTGEGITDDIGTIKQTIMGFMAGSGDPTAYGFGNMGDMLGAVMDGTIDDMGYWDDIAGVADEYVDDESAGKDISDFSAHNAFDAMDNFFASSFASGGVGATVLNISKGISKVVGSNTTSSCDDIKSGALDLDALVKPLMAADDVATFGAVYGDSDGVAVYYGMIEKCMAISGGCEDMKNDPGAYWGFMHSYGGDYSDVYNGGVFDDTALEGGFLAAKSCDGATWEEMEDCAEGMYGTVYTGAGGNWDQFMAGGEFNADEFEYYGGYYTTQAADGTVGGTSYADVFTNGQTYAGDAGTMDAIDMCKQSLEAQGIFDYNPCYGNYNPETGGGDGPPPVVDCEGMCQTSCVMAPHPAECQINCVTLCQ